MGVINKDEQKVIISEQPKNVYNATTASQVLSIAKSYLAHADRLIYSYGSRTFLSGYDLFDMQYDGKGNIDCSTFVLLVLAGIWYEDSPYSTGSVKNIIPQTLVDMHFSCFDKIPERYITIAERIGFPELADPKGLNLELAAALGITEEQLIMRIRKTDFTRRTVQLARSFYDRGELFLNQDFRMPGDVVFYQADSFFRDMQQKKENPLEVTHVGIVSENIDEMIHSSGYVSKERAIERQESAVSVSTVYGKRTPVFFARPRYISNI